MAKITSFSDFELTEDLSALKIENGDFVIKELPQQASKILMLSPKGSWQDKPLFGVGIVNYLNAPLTGLQVLRLRAEIQKAHLADGHNAVRIEITHENEQMKININV